jgi:hypothetical protein
VADAGLHFPFSIGILNPARHCHRSVVSEDVSKKWVDRGIVEVRNHAFFQVVENHYFRTTTRPPKCFLMQFSPSAYTQSPGEQAHRLAAVAERQHEQPCPAILAALRIAHHRTTAVVDLCFFSRCGDDDACCFRTSRAAQLAYKTLHRLIVARKTVVRHQVLPDRLAIAAKREALFDQFSVCFTGTSDGRCW